MGLYYDVHARPAESLDYELSKRHKGPHRVITIIFYSTIIVLQNSRLPNSLHGFEDCVCLDLHHSSADCRVFYAKPLRVLTRITILTVRAVRLGSKYLGAQVSWSRG